MPIRVLVADDHEVVRQGLRTFLEIDPDLEVVGEAADGRQAVRIAHRLRPDVVLMDLLMPEPDRITATRQIRYELPDIEVRIERCRIVRPGVSPAVVSSPY